MKIIRLSCIALFFSSLIAGCSTTVKVTDTDLGQHEMKYSATVKKEVNMNYLLYLPDEYVKDGTKFPLVLFLHGSGERGSDVKKVERHGPPKLVSQGKKFPFILVSPQCPDGEGWDAFALNSLLDFIIENYKVDPSRVYLTGLSMGGFGTWDLAIRYPDKFAAIAPVCGGGDDSKVCALKNVPVWVFHGKLDNVVSPLESEKMVKALRDCGGDVQFTLYPDANHDSWTKTYENDEFYIWMLSKMKK